MKKNKSQYGVIPLYSRIESLLRNKILSGEYESGEKLPTEDELVQYFKVSKVTIRSALNHLKNNGLIVQIQGRGTYVAENIPLQKQFVLTGDVQSILIDAERYEVNVLGIQTLTNGLSRIDRNTRQFFNLPNEVEISRVQRVRLLKGTPIYYLENYMSPEIAQHLTVDELSKKPLLKIIKKKIGLVIGKGELYIEAVPAEAYIADILNCNIFDPLILFQIYYWFPNRSPFQKVKCFMKSELFRYKKNMNTNGF